MRGFQLKPGIGKLSLNGGYYTAAERRRPAGSGVLAQPVQRLSQDRGTVRVGPPLLHVSQVRLVRLAVRRARRIGLVPASRIAATRAVPGFRNRGSQAKLGRVSCLLAHQKETRIRRAASPRSASPIGPAPTRLPLIALPLLTAHPLVHLLIGMV